MAGRQYIVFNGASPTTAGQVKMAVTTSINTLVQVATPATTEIVVMAWGISFDASAAAVPVLVELLQTDVAATAGTSLTPTLYGSTVAASLCVGGTGATMFNDGAITEGTITATRVFDCQLVAPTGAYAVQFPLGREPVVSISKFLRIRTTAPAAVNAICWIQWEE